MRRIALGALVLLTVAGCGTGVPALRVLRGELRVGDMERTFVLVAPPVRDGDRLPLVIAFHGTGESGAAFRTETGLDKLASRDRFIVAYPDAPVGNWAEGCDCTLADRLGINDTGFVALLIDSVAARFPVDPGSVFAVGFSQGGLFVHRLACELSDRIAGVASISAPMSAILAERCAPQRPLSVLVMMGTLDNAFPYEGSGRGDRATLGARATAGLWRTLNRCTGPGVATELRNRAADGTRVLEERWTTCAGGAEVVLLTVDGGRHAWTLSRDARTAGLVAGFFLQHRR